jgi:hypothetical protein
MKKIISGGIPFLWMGMVLAISFMEAPLKFQAPGITVELGLGIGRIIFSTLNIIEIILAITLGLTWLSLPWKKKTTWYLLAVGIILLFQTTWLLPVLDQRATELLQGNPPEPAMYHTLYIVLDASKIILLALIGSINIQHDDKE